MTAIDTKEMDGNPIDTNIGATRPLQSVRRYCLWCCNDQTNEVRLCPADNCPLHIYRFGHKPNDTDGTEPTVLRSIRLRCVDCSCHKRKDVRKCWNIECALYPYRMGRNPNRAGIGGSIDTLHRWRENQEMLGSSDDPEADEEKAMELVTAGEFDI